ncbi:DUF7350 domain-containing protein [Halostagnicola bangensis]
MSSPPERATEAAEATEAAGVGGTDKTYLAISPRTAYNRCILPFASLSATVTRDGGEIASEELTEAIGPDLEHHYGADLEIEAFQVGDEVSISLETPPQLSRHEGYETAFFDLEDQRVRLAERNAR